MQYGFEVYSSDREASVMVDGLDTFYVAPVGVAYPVDDAWKATRQANIDEHIDDVYDRIRWVLGLTSEQYRHLSVTSGTYGG